MVRTGEDQGLGNLSAFLAVRTEVYLHHDMLLYLCCCQVFCPIKSRAARSITSGRHQRTCFSMLLTFYLQLTSIYMFPRPLNS